MLQKIESFMEKLLPGLVRDIDVRKKQTEMVVKRSHDARTESENQVFAAYREVGIITSRTGHPRKWD